MAKPLEKRIEELRAQNRELRELVKEAFQPMNPPMPPQMQGAPPMDPAMMQGAPTMDPAMMQQGPPPPAPPAIDPAQIDAIMEGLNDLAGGFEQLAAKLREQESTIMIREKDIARLQNQVKDMEQDLYELGRTVAQLEAAPPAVGM